MIPKKTEPRNPTSAGITGYKAAHLFCIVSALAIGISAISPIPVDAGGEIGLAARPLAIGDRYFYINDNTPLESPLSSNGNVAQPLYPWILRICSFAAMALGQDTQSMIWNALIITAAWAASFGTLISLQKMTLLAFNRRAAGRATLIYATCPYTYYYILSGGLTAFVLFTYSAYCLAIVNTVLVIRRGDVVSNKLWFNQISIGILMSLLRPSGLPIALAMQSGIVIVCLLRRITLQKRTDILLRSVSKINLVAALVILGTTCLACIIAIAPSATYVKNASRAYDVEYGTHMGIERAHLRELIKNDQSSSEVATRIRGLVVLGTWKVTDGFFGINDIRSAYASSAQSPHTLGTLIRGLTGILFMLPVFYMAIGGLACNINRVIESGLWIPLIATATNMAYSLMGFSISRYYIMVWTPMICLAGLMWCNLGNNSDPKCADTF